MKIEFLNENGEHQTIEAGFDFMKVTHDEAITGFKIDDRSSSSHGVTLPTMGVFEILMHAEKILTEEVAYAMKYPTYQQQKILNTILLTYAGFRDEKIGFGYCYT